MQQRWRDDYPALKIGQVVKFDSNRRDVAGVVTEIRRIEPHWDELEYHVKWSDPSLDGWYGVMDLMTVSPLVALAFMATDAAEQTEEVDKC